MGDNTTIQPLPVRIVLIDDHLARAKLRRLLQNCPEIQIVAEASDAEEAIYLIKTHQPDVVLMDSILPLPRNLEMVAHVTKALPQLRVMMLSSQRHGSATQQALHAGVTAYVFQEATGQAVEHITRAVAESLSLAEAGNTADITWQRLTPRQRDVLRLIVQGLTTKEIAHRLQRSVKTIEAHRRQMMQRLGVHNVAELVRDAMQHNLHAADMASW